MKRDIFDQYVERVIHKFQIEREVLFSQSKKRASVDARQFLYYLCSRRSMQVSYIQKYMAESGLPVQHSTICHGISVMERKVKHDSDYASIIKHIERSVSA